MGKDQKKMLIGLACHYHCAELKYLTAGLLFVFSLITVLRFLPLSPKLSLSSVPACLLNVSAVQIPPPPLPNSNDIVTKRHFRPYGSAAYAFILMSSYRTGPHTFSLIGLSSKPLHMFGRPSYTCLWVPHDVTLQSVSTVGEKTLPDWGYGRVYTTVIVICTFPPGASDSDGVSDSAGGKLFLVAASNGGDDRYNQNETIEALTEKPRAKSLALSTNLTEPPKYDYLYCGSSLYGDLSPQRVREWVAHHVRLFGERSHLVFYDAGGVHEAVLEVLRPWMELGYVTLHDIREQERFDGYYHNQFLIVNDCLHRYRFDAKWIFFFDVDEFLYLPKKKTIKFVTDSLSGFSQFMFEQMPMSNQLCMEDNRDTANKKWGIEKLVYRDVKRVRRRDRKYAVQPRNVFATGVHMSQNLVGKTSNNALGLIKYFHYHGTVSIRDEPCHQFTNATFINVDGTPYVLDTTMRGIAPTVRKFELKMIGTKLRGTRQ